MNKPVLGLILGGVLGALDGLTALVSAPEVAPQIVGIVIGSMGKGPGGGPSDRMDRPEAAFPPAGSPHRPGHRCAAGTARSRWAPIRPPASAYFWEIMIPGLDCGAHRGIRHPEIRPAGRAESLIVSALQPVERSNSCRVRFTSRFPPTIRSGPSVFHKGVFGWTFQKWEGPMPYWMVLTGREHARDRRRDPSASASGAGDRSTQWMCLRVTSSRSGREAGGKIVVPKMAIPGIGWLAYCTDPEGNTFGILQADDKAA